MTDSTIALIERLRSYSAYDGDTADEAADALTTLLERCEKAEAALKREEAHSQELGDKIDEAESFIILIADRNKELERQRDEARKALEQTKEECADFVKHWLIESDNEYAVEVAVECSHALLKWDGKS